MFGDIRTIPPPAPWTTIFLSFARNWNASPPVRYTSARYTEWVTSSCGEILGPFIRARLARFLRTFRKRAGASNASADAFSAVDGADHGGADRDEPSGRAP